MNNPSIAIITPLYNDENHVIIAINSVIKQNYPNYKFIYDDASKDGSRKKVVDFIENNPHSKIELVISDTNNG